MRLHCAEYQTYDTTKLAQSGTLWVKHAHKRALVLTARKLVRLIDALLRAGTLYHDPRQDPKEVRTAPSASRPRPQRRARRVPSAH